MQDVTAVISSLSKRSGSGRISLRVLVQISNEGAEGYSKLLFAGLEPLASQFTASYGMALKLLAGAKVTRRSNESNEMKVLQPGRTLEESRKLVERSSEHMLATMWCCLLQKRSWLKYREIETLTSEISDEAIDRKSRKILSDVAYKEIAVLQEQLKEDKRLRTELSWTMETKRLKMLWSFGWKSWKMIIYPFCACNTKTLREWNIHCLLFIWGMLIQLMVQNLRTWFLPLIHQHRLLHRV